MPPIAFAFLSIGLSVAAQFAMKRGVAAVPAAAGLDGRWFAGVAAQPMLWAGLAMYAASAVLWLAVLARWDVSKAYPLVGAGFAASVAIGWWLGEAVSVQRAAGVAAICAGVWLVARS